MKYILKAKIPSCHRNWRIMIKTDSIEEVLKNIEKLKGGEYAFTIVKEVWKFKCKPNWSKRFTTCILDFDTEMSAKFWVIKQGLDELPKDSWKIVKEEKMLPYEWWKEFIWGDDKNV